MNYIDSLHNGTITKADHMIAENIQISEFNPEDLKNIVGGGSLILAPTGSGKSFLIKDLLYHIKDEFDCIILMSKTAKLQSFYDFVDRNCIIDDFDEQFLSNLWEKQKNEYLSSKKGTKNKMKKYLIILDDIINSDSYKKSKILDDLYTGGRHLGIGVWLLSQNYTSIKPKHRNNCRFVACFNLDSCHEKDNFVTQFMPSINKRVGTLLFDKITREKPYQCCIVQEYKNGANLEEKVKKYVAQERNLKIKKNTEIAVSNNKSIKDDLLGSEITIRRKIYYFSLK